MRPLDRVGSLKLKLGAVIVAAVGVTVVSVYVGVRLGAPLWISGLAAGILSLAMVQFLARGMTSPLREMAVAAGDMATGDYSKRVTETSQDEVGDLARAFNNMAADLAQLDQTRRDLVANVSHELRTPISALRAVLENIVDGIEPPDLATLETMLHQVERLGRLVQQLLDLSRLESGALPLERKTVAARSLLERAVHEWRVNAEHTDGSAHINVAVEVRPPDLELYADPERVHQVIANLVSNAVRHSPQGGRVVVGAQREAHAVAFEVTDEGPGVPPTESARVFGRFYRLDEGRAAMDGGSGLGLAIARWIVELHGGEISIEDQEPTGARFVVRLPQGEL